MAQKIGLALIALFGLVNGEIYASNHYILGRAPAVSFSGKSNHDEDDTHAKGELLGQHHVQLGILNFANRSGHSLEKDDDEHSKRRNDDSSEKRGDRKIKISLDKKREYSNDKRKDSYDRKKKGDSNDRKNKEKKRNQTPDRKKVSVQKKTQGLVKKKGYISTEKRSYSKEKVAIPVFKKLTYVDNDSHGQAQKAPITIVTAPLISTAEIQGHKVGAKTGKPKCPQCIEQNHEAKQTAKTASKSIQRFDDLLKTKIVAPIKNVEVHEQSHSDDDDNLQRRFDGYQGAKINKKKLNHQLAQGDRNEKRLNPIVSVVIPHKLNEQQEHSEDHNGHKNHGSLHKEHHGHDHENQNHECESESEEHKNDLHRQKGLRGHN